MPRERNKFQEKDRLQSSGTFKKVNKQDNINTADSAFIFLIILLISQRNGQVGQGREQGLVLSGLCYKDSQDDFDSEEYIGFDWSPDH